MNRIKNELYKKWTYKKIMYKKWTYKKWNYKKWMYKKRTYKEWTYKKRTDPKKATWLISNVWSLHNANSFAKPQLFAKILYSLWPWGTRWGKQQEIRGKKQEIQVSCHYPFKLLNCMRIGGDDWVVKQMLMGRENKNFIA